MIAPDYLRGGRGPHSALVLEPLAEGEAFHAVFDEEEGDGAGGADLRKVGEGEREGERREEMAREGRTWKVREGGGEGERRGEKAKEGVRSFSLVSPRALRCARRRDTHLRGFRHRWRRW